MEDEQDWTYCVVGNIKITHYDEDVTLRYGTAAFTGGTVEIHKKNHFCYKAKVILLFYK